MSPMRPFMPPYQPPGTPGMRPMMPMAPGQMYPGTPQGLGLPGMASPHSGMPMLPPTPGMSSPYPSTNPPGTSPGGKLPGYPPGIQHSVHASQPLGPGMVPKQPVSCLDASGAVLPSNQSHSAASGLSALQDMLQRPFNSMSTDADDINRRPLAADETSNFWLGPGRQF